MEQRNPRLHDDSQNDVTQFRSDVLTNRHNEQEQDQANHRRQHSNINCPICLTNSTFPIETNCGHIFCGNPLPIKYYTNLIL